MIFLLLLFLQNPFCESSGFNLQPGSDAIGYGELTELHCPVAGPDIDGIGCIVWYKDPPDAGACLFIANSMMPLIGDISVEILNNP